jgi:formate transporter FocA
MADGMKLEALLPPDMALRAEEIGIRKSHLDFWTTFVLAVLAGAFIALGACFATTVTTGAGDALPYGLSRALGGLAFCLGLVLVVVGGAELFTGNNLIVMAWASGRISLGRLLRNWTIVLAGNFAGALATAALVLVSGHHTFGRGSVGANALAIAESKVEMGFGQAVALGTLCNALVCLAVWMTHSARSTTDRVLAVLFPVTAFVAAGFEHSVANMYFIPAGLLIKASAAPAFWESIGSAPPEYASLTWSAFVLRNLLPVTAGNVVGGGLMVGAVYWFVYLRPRGAAARAGDEQR